MIQVYKVFDPVFKCEFRLFCNGSGKEFLSAIKPYIADLSQFEDCESYPGITAICDSGAICIYMPNLNHDDPRHIGILAHECVHAMQRRVWERCGVKENEWEVSAYYVEFLLTEFLNKIKKGNKKK